MGTLVSVPPLLPRTDKDIPDVNNQLHVARRLILLVFIPELFF